MDALPSALTQAAISLTVNGRPVTLTVEPRTHLADALREHLNLTGTHLGCEQGVCGACTVVIDGKPQRSCIAYAVDCEGSEITTIEGFYNDPIMADLRGAFATHHGLQCGFCTPGMLITARDIVLRLGDIPESRIRQELAGNLCRCTGYVGIVDAVRAVVAGRQPACATQPAGPKPATGHSPTTIPAESNQKPAERPNSSGEPEAVESGSDPRANLEPATLPTPTARAVSRLALLRSLLKLGFFRRG